MGRCAAFGWLLLATLGPLGCSSSHQGEDAGAEAGTEDGSSPTCDCRPLPPGCRYTGDACCTGLVCDDAGPPPCECPAPPPGCTYTECCSGLECAGDADAGSAVVCGTGEDRFPSFDRSCSVDTDCVIASHQTDCCGSIRAMGINRDEHERFREAEMACRAMYPDCGCASMMMTADDGTTGAFPLVHCSSGTCATTFTAP